MILLLLACHARGLTGPELAHGYDSHECHVMWVKPAGQSWRIKMSDPAISALVLWTLLIFRLGRWSHREGH